MSDRLGRNFSLLWAAQAVSLVGSEISAVAIPLFAIGMMDLDAASLGGLLALQGIPPVLFGVFAGVWVDRVSQKKLLLASDVLRALLVAMIPLLYWLDLLTVEALFVFTFLVASVTVFADIAYWSVIPKVVPEHQLLIGNSRLSMTQSMATTGGPGVAGVIASLLGPTVALVVDAASYLASFVFTRKVDARDADSVPARSEPMLEALLAGLRFVIGNRKILLLALGAAIWHLVYFSLLTMLFIYLAKDLEAPAYIVGLILSCGGAGALLGAWLLSRASLKAGKMRWLGLTLVAAQAPLLLISLAYNQGWVAQAAVALALLLSGAGGAAHSILHLTLRQEETPRELLGRMTSVVRLVSWGAMPLGSLLGGLLLSQYSVQVAFQLNSATGAVLTFVWVLFLMPCLAEEKLLARLGGKING